MAVEFRHPNPISAIEHPDHLELTEVPDPVPQPAKAKSIGGQSLLESLSANDQAAIRAANSLSQRFNYSTRVIVGSPNFSMTVIFS